MAGLSYAFNVQQGETPETVARRRAVAEALLARSVGSAPQTIGEGLNSLGAAIGGRLAMGRAERSEAAGRAQGDAAFSSLFSGGGTPAAPVVAGGGGTSTMVGGGGADAIRAGLVARGLPEHVADAFVMNFQDESGLDPGINEANPIVPGSRGGYGLYQLTGPRRRAYEAYAAERGIDPSNVDAQLDFMMTELKGPEQAAFKSIMAAPDTGSAAAAIVNKFLRPAESHRASREARYLRSGGAPAVAQALAGGGGTPTMAGGAGGDVLTQPAPQPPAPAQARPMGTDPFTRRGPAFDRVANAGHDSLAPTGGVAAVAQALAPRPAPAPVAAPPVPAGGVSSGGMARAAPAPVAPPVAAPAASGVVHPPQPGQTMGQAPAQSGGMSPRLTQLLQTAANPWLSDGQRGVVEFMLKQEMAKSDPAAQLEIQKTLAEIEKLRRPDTTNVGNRVVNAQTGEVIYEGPQAPTTDMQNYGAYAEYEKANGRTPLGPLEYEQAVRKAGATSIDNRQMGTIPPGYKATYDDNGNVTRLDPIEGGPAAAEATAAGAAADASIGNQADKAETMLSATAKIRDEIKNSTVPATGTLSQPFAMYSGSAAGRVRSYVSALQSGVALQAMMKLKEASATGATGFGALSERELSVLISQIGALDPDNTEPDIFLETLDRIESQWKRTLANVKRTVPPEKLRELGIDIDSLMAGPQAAGGDGIPTVSTVEEAAALPPGTKFRTPDGRIKVRP